MGAQTDTPQVKKKKILLIDDEIFFLQITKMTLDKTGKYEVAALIGAVDLAKRVGEFGPDIILLDISMPGVSGIDVCRSLKNNPALKSIPVVMFSAMSRNTDKKMASEAGADDFIDKPVKRDDLINKIEEVLSRQK